MTLALTKVRDYLALCKPRLNLLVVISSVFGYLLAVDVVLWWELIFLAIAGFLVTGSSNAVNQALEKDLDAKMERTSGRPLASGRMGISEALVFAIFSGLAGIFLLWYVFDPLSAMLGALALFIYAFLYTPLKQKTPFAVFVGAFPGAIPPMLGWVAATGQFGPIPGALFAMQFVWQFPHFWAIAWVKDADYQKAGFRLLPSPGGKDQSSSFQILLYSFFMTPAALLPFFFDLTGVVSLWFVIIAGLLFLIPAFKLFLTGETKDAKKVMFASFIYLPMIQLVYVLDKV